MRVITGTFILRCWMIILAVPVSIVFGQQGGAGREPNLKIKYTTDFVIKGDGSATNWKAANWNQITPRSNNILRNAGWHIVEEPGDNIESPYKTKFKILYSEKGIYCLYQCDDSIITATLKADNLALYTEDVVEAFFLPDTTKRVYFEYEVSPLNFELALDIVNNNGKFKGSKTLQSEGARTIHAVSIIEKQTGVGRLSWTAEFFIPFTLLQSTGSIPPKKGTLWRANFYRIDYDRKPVYSSWSLTRKGFHDPEKFGTIEFE